MKIYIVELFGGTRTGLIAAKNIKAAKREIIEDEGRNNVSDVRIATEEEIEWVRAMGGYVPNVTA